MNTVVKINGTTKIQLTKKNGETRTVGRGDQVYSNLHGKVVRIKEIQDCYVSTMDHNGITLPDDVHIIQLMPMC